MRSREVRWVSIAVAVDSPLPGRLGGVVGGGWGWGWGWGLGGVYERMVGEGLWVKGRGEREEGRVAVRGEQ